MNKRVLVIYVQKDKTTNTVSGHVNEVYDNYVVIETSTPIYLQDAEYESTIPVKIRFKDITKIEIFPSKASQ